LHVDCIVSSNFSIDTLMSFCSANIAFSFPFISLELPSLFQFENSLNSTGVSFCKNQRIVLLLRTVSLGNCTFVLCRRRNLG
jgi:hypothetical protein